MKRFVKHTLKYTLPSTVSPLVVASMGRSGSTLIYQALVKGMARKRFGRLGCRLEGVVRDVSWELSVQSFANGRIYKTHGLPYGLISGNRPKVVFLFGSATDAARSVLHCETTYGLSWIKEHFIHLSATGSLEELPARDVLRFGEQLDAWLGCESVPVLALRYEDLWDSNAEEILTRFAGFPVSLPTRRERASGNSDLGPETNKIEETYASLDQRIATLPSVHVNSRAREVLENR